MFHPDFKREAKKTRVGIKFSCRHLSFPATPPLVNSLPVKSQSSHTFFLFLPASCPLVLKPLVGIKSYYTVFQYNNIYHMKPVVNEMLVLLIHGGSI